MESPKFWKKRIGDTHIMDGNNTLCGIPMLGNNWGKDETSATCQVCCEKEFLKDKRYYKGKRYKLIASESTLSRLQEESNEKITLLVETKALKTVEEHEEELKNRRSTHVNWVN